MENSKLIKIFDRVIFVCLCLLMFCLPFTKAGVETFAWLAIFLFIFKKILEYKLHPSGRMLQKTPLNIALAILIAANIMSLIFSVNTALSLRGFFGKQLKFVAIFFLVSETINSKKRLKIFLLTIFAILVLLAVDLYIQYVTGYDFLRGYKGFSLDWPCEMLRASFGTSGDFAGWLLIILPFCIGALFTQGFFDKRDKIEFSALIFVFLICLLFTFSRGAWLGAIIGSLLLAFYWFKYEKSKAKVKCLCWALCLILIFVFLPKQVKNKGENFVRHSIRQSGPVIDRIKSIGQTNKGSNLERIRLWQEALNITRDYPLFGCGLNTYSIVARKYKIAEGGGIYAHNSFLQMAAETGLIGLFAFFLVIFAFFISALSHLNKTRNPLVLGLAAGILGFLVQSFFDTNLYALQLVVLFWFSLGLTIAIIRLDQNEKERIQ